jgi:hypothetical protein
MTVTSAPHRDDALTDDLAAIAAICECYIDADGQPRVGLACPVHGIAHIVRAVSPEIVCLCGSTRFAKDFNRVAQELALAGAIVVRPEVVTYDRGADPQHVDPEVKARLDELHLRKIDLVDRVLVLNVGGYIGESTRREIDYATAEGKPIEYLEPIGEECGVCGGVVAERASR